ncbi:MAG: hypothetical protein VKI83_07360, partial [Synechococcaceae cyanobacterium]|nr:hypothetical protein [Synechococcaceae cyanobacterium]
NRLAANQRTPADPWCFASVSSGRDWLALLAQRGWRLEGRLRSSVASFGLGASLSEAGGGWCQVPLGLPLRTGLLEPGEEQTNREMVNREEAMALLPHTALELSLQDGRGSEVLLQYYQGSEGLCGWEGLNDLHRPWQNDRANGTVRYLAQPYRGERLLELIELSELMALVHNSTASRLGLRFGGYGTLGFCIDTTALLQQAMEGRCDLFPLLLSGIWRQRLLDETQRCSPRSEQARRRYLEALERLPLDLSHHGASRADAWRRLQACQPISSPFTLVRQCRERPSGDL